MALPVIGEAVDCGNFTTTVLPYLYQLQPLPQILFESIQNPIALKQIYLDTNPLITALAFAIATAPIFLLISEITRNVSQVDRAWSILPTIFVIHYAVYAYLDGLNSKRVMVATVVSSLWSIRLTHNYFRKGGYSIGSEDYRWVVVKRNVGPALFFLFNVVFISLAQPVLLFLITSPTYVLLLSGRLAKYNPDTPDWEIGDFIATFVMLGCISLAALADQQQWDYQTAKSSYRKTAKVPTGFLQADLDRGFVTTGLWAYSRHPNFMAEQSFWSAFYLWSCFVCRSVYNWSVVGMLGYLALFQASTWLTELITAGKYPDYKEYQEQVGKFLPKTDSDGPVFSTDSNTDGDTKQITDATQARERYDLR